MSEADIDQNEPRRTGCDNDCFSETFASMLDKRFRSPVPVQSPEAETDIVAETEIKSDVLPAPDPYEESSLNPQVPETA